MKASLFRARMHAVRNQNRRRTQARRRCRLELLEPRQLLASDWTNVLQPLNTTGESNQDVSPLDVLVVINEINAPTIRDNINSPLPPMGANGKAPPPFVDVDCDNFVTPLDVLRVIDAINAKKIPLGWQFSQTGGIGSGSGSVTASSCSPKLQEGNSLVTSLTTEFVVPPDASSIVFEYESLFFDTTSSGLMRDAFEAALLDAKDRPLVTTLGVGRDGFFNASEGIGEITTQQATAAQGKVTLSLAGVLPGETAKLVLRLVNNDADTRSSVVVRSVRFEANAPSLPAGSMVGPNIPLADASTQYVPPFPPVTDEATAVLPSVPPEGSVVGKPVDAPLPSNPTPPPLGNAPPPSSGAIDSRGTEFWIGFPDNLFEGANVPQKVLFLTGDEATTGIVEIPGLIDPFTNQPFRVAFAINPGEVTTVELPSLDVGDNTDPQTDYDVEAEAISKVEKKGVHVTSGLPITVYGLNRAISTTDAFLALPVSALGNEYLQIGYQNTNRLISSTNGTQLLVVATEDNTLVHIDPGQYSPLLKEAIAILRRPDGSIPFGYQTTDGDDLGLYTTEAAGTYRWQVSPGTDGYAGTYTARVLDLESSATPIAIGQRVPVSFPTGRDLRVFSIPINAGQQLYFDSQNTPFAPAVNVRILSPSGKVQHVSGDNNTFANLFGALQFSETGTYHVFLSGEQSTAFNMAFQVLDMDNAPIYSLGTTIDSHLLMGEAKLFRFQGTAGQRLYFNGQATHRSTLATLLGPGGTNLLTVTSADDQYVTLPVDGTYYIIESNGGNDLPDRFRFDSIDAAPLLVDQQSFVTAYQQLRGTVYRFDAQAGDNLELLKVRFPNPFRTYVEVRDPTGASVNLDSQPTRFAAQLIKAGTYSITIRGVGYGDFGEVELQLGLTHAAPVTNSGFNTTETLTIAAGESRTYTFTGNVGSTVILDSLDATAENLVIDFRDPSGGLISTYSESQDLFAGNPIFLPKSGNYTLTLRGSNSSAAGSYTFRVLHLDSFATNIAFNTDVVSNFPTGREIQVYSVNATAGQVIAWDGQSDAFVNAVVIDPLLRTIISSNTQTDAQGVARSTGKHFVVLYGQSSSAMSIPFRMHSLSSAPLIGFGTEISGTLAPGRSFTAYRMELQAGTPIRVDSFENDGDDASIAILNAGGRILYNQTSNADSGPPSVPFVVVNEPGTYYVVVAGRQTQNPDYRFRIDDLSVAPTLSFDTDQTIAMQGLEARVFRFEATAGELISINRLDASAQGAIWQVTSGSNQFLGGDNNAHSFTARILRTGTHYLAISGYQNLGNLQFQFRATKQAPSPVNLSGVNSYFTVSPGMYETAEYSFTAPIGRLLYLDVQSSSFGIPEQSVTLQKGDTYLVRNARGTSFGVVPDLTGTIVTSDKPIAVFGGNRATFIPEGYFAADHLVEQMPPTNAWGTRFVTAPFETGSTRGDLVRMVARDQATTITINGTVVATIDRGQYYEQILNQSALIETSKPVLLAQYANSQEYYQQGTGGNPSFRGDPFMIIVAPFEQFMNSYRVTTPAEDSIPVGSRFDRNYIQIVTTNDAIGSIELDGVPIAPSQFRAIGSSGYSSANIPVALGAYGVASPFPFGVSVYGFGSFDSYGYAGGQSLAAVGNVATIGVSPKQSSKVLNQSQTFRAVLKDANGLPVSNVRVDWDVSGVNPERSFSYSNEQGIAEFTYVGDAAGRDVITASVGSKIDDAIIDWEADAAAPTLIVHQPLDGSNVVAGRTVTATGRFFVDTPRAGLDLLTVNDQVIDRIDASGQFFVSLFVGPGENAFDFVVTDTLGHQATQRLVITGESADSNAVDFRQYSDITGSFELVYARSSYRQETQTLVADIAVRNAGLYAAGTPLLVGIKNLSDPEVQVRNADGITPDGIPYYDFTESTLSGELDSGSVTTLLAATFFAPNQSQFTYDLVFYGRLNRPPQVDSLPPLQAIVGRSYEYAVHASDADGNTLAFELVQGPVGMTISPTTGLLQWNPSATDVGNHQVEILVSDGRTGVSSQAFVITARPPLPNRPPIFTSNPTTLAHAEQPWEYALSTFDPDGDSVQYRIVSAPAGVTLNAAASKLTWTPTPFEIGVHGIEVEAFDASGGRGTQSFSVYVGMSPNNTPPVFVNEWPDVATVGRLFSVALQVNDAEGDALVYQLLQAPAGMNLTGTGNQRALEWTPNGTHLGRNDVRVRVSDGRGGFGILERSVQVGTSQPPHIVSSPPTQASVGAATHYSVLATDADQDVLRYTLERGPSGMVIDASTGFLSWTPDASAYANESVRIRVTDPWGLSDLQVFTISVSGGQVAPRNAVPQVTPQPNQQATTGRAWTYRVDAYDREEESLRFDLVRGPFGMAVDSNTGMVSWTPRNEDIGRHTIVVRVRDSQGGIALDAFDIDVKPLTAAPIITSTPPLRSRLQTGWEYVLQAQSPDLAPLTYALLQSPSGMTLTVDPTGLPTARLAWTPTQVGSFPVTWSVMDSTGNRTLQSFTIEVLTASNNTPPEFRSSPRTEIPIGQGWVYRPQAFDFDFNPLEYSLVRSPSGVLFDASTNTLSWVPTSSHVGDQEFEIAVIDGQGGSRSQTFTVHVSDQVNNHKPIIVSSPRAYIATTDEGYIYDVVARDPDNDPVLWSLIEYPDGMTLDPVLGRLRWIPSLSDVGSRRIVLQVQDPSGLTSRQAFSIIVAPVNLPPVILSQPGVEAVAGEAYVYGVRGSDPEGGPLHYELLAGPQGMSIDGDRGIVRWTPSINATGQSNVHLQVTDSRGATAKQEFRITVSATEANRPPVFESRPPFRAIVGLEYKYDPIARDPEESTLTFTLIESPTGMTIDSSSGAIRWTPTANQTGAHLVRLVATDADGKFVEQRFAIQSRVNREPIFLSTPVTEVAIGDTYHYDAKAIDPDRDAIAYELLAGPMDMTIDPLGRLQWTAPSVISGPFNITVRVRDAFGAEQTQSFVLTITPDSIAPNIELDVSQNPIAIGIPNIAMIRVSDNIGVESVTLTLDGTPISVAADGTATLPSLSSGNYVLIAAAVDASGNRGESTVSLRVYDPSDVAGPSIVITAPSARSITAPTHIVGSINDPNLDWYRVEFARADRVNPADPEASDADFQTLAFGRLNVANGILASLDPTRLTNDDYVIRVQARDLSGNVTTEWIPISVEGNLKLGQFFFELTDLVVPLAGIPIHIVRRYDSLKADEQGDFGYGWSMGIREGSIRESIPVNPLEADGLAMAATPFEDGTRVFITAPDGQRLGFTFAPVRQFSLFGGGSYAPRFVPDPGVNHRLDVGSVPLRKIGNAYFTGFFGEPFNPSAYRLTLQDGTIYEYGQFSGLDNIQSPTGVRLEFRPDGIFSSTGPSIQWLRDAQGRLVQLVDPAGNSLHYTYDLAGDLQSVTNAEGMATRYVYLNSPKHLLSQSFDPSGNLVFQATFDAQGRLATTSNAAGAVLRNTYDLANLRETTTDPLGNRSTTTFDTRGNPIQVDRPNGTIHLQYDANDNVITAIDEAGNRVTRTVDAQGNPTSITDPLQNTYNSTFDEAGRLRSATNPLGSQSVMIYDDHGNLTQVINAAGDTTSAEYDDLGRVVKYTDASGNSTTYTYATGPRPTRATTFSVSGNSQQPVAIATRRFEYNDLGQLTQEIDGNGNATSFEYDKLGRPTKQTSALGNAFRYVYEGQNLAATIDPLGRKTRFEYDAVGRRTRVIMPDGSAYAVTYDANNQLTRLVDPLGRSVVFTYRPDGNLESETDALGFVTRYEYDAVGNRTAIIDAFMAKWEYEYDALGRIVRETDPLDGVIQRTFDAAGQLVARSDARGNTTRFDYDTLGRKTQEVDPLGNEMRWERDANGNIARFVDPNGNAYEFEYDALNRMIVERMPNGGEQTQSFDAAGNRTRFVNELGSVYEYRYDADNRGVEFINPDGGHAIRTYDAAGNVVRFTNEIGNSVTYTYDVMNRQTGVLNGDGKTTRMSYDKMGNLTSVVDTLGNQTAYQYDARDQLVKIVDPLGHVATFQYDAVGNRIGETDRNGRQIRYVRDALGRMVREEWLVQGSVVETTLMEYDANHNLTKIEDGNRRLQFSYDANDRRVTQTETGIDGVPSLVLSQQFDANGNVTSLSDNAGVTVARSMNAINRSQTTLWSGAGISPLRLDSFYNLRGDLTAQTRFRDLTGQQLSGRSEWDFDHAGRLNHIVHYADQAGQLVPVEEHAYVYDAFYRVVADISSIEATTYTYDGANQLVRADHVAKADEVYTYDANGNRTNSGEVVSANNKIARDNQFTYSYDAEGNIAQKTERLTGVTTQYQYDHRNRLVAVVERAANGTIQHQAQYEYDPLDRRVAATVDGNKVSTAYVGQSPWADYKGDGSIAARYMPGEEVDDLFARYRPGEGSSWYLKDRLGSITDLLASNGAVINSTTYDSFGNIVDEVNPAAGDRFKFTGREWDATTELYHYRARNYDPKLGRFISEDPLGFAAGDSNLQRYVNNNPINFTDPSGMQGIAETGGLYDFVSVYASFALTWGADTPFTFRLACQEGMCGISGSMPNPSMSVANLSYGPVLDIFGADDSYNPGGGMGLLLKGSMYLAKHFNGGVGVNSEGQFCVNYGIQEWGFNPSATECGGAATLGIGLNGPPAPGFSTDTSSIPQFPSMPRNGDFDFFVITTATSPHLVISADLTLFVSVGTELSLIAKAAVAENWVESVEVDYEAKTDSPMTKAAVKSHGFADLNPRFPNEGSDSDQTPPYPHGDLVVDDDLWPEEEDEDEDEEDEEEGDDEGDEDEGDSGECDVLAIGDWVWYDINEDGIQNDGELGTEDVVVELWTPGADGVRGGGDDAIVQTTITDERGLYLFEDLAPGAYFVRFVLSTIPLGYKPTLRDATDDTFDSDADDEGYDQVILVGACMVETRRDMGIVPE